jgi:lysozyme
MKTSETGIQLIEQFEGLRLQAYTDVVGVWTNGYGNTHGVIPGSTVTQAQAESDLLSNIAGSEYVVNTVVKVPLNQNQFDALVDFVFNLGSGNFQSSTLLRKLNAGDFAGANLEFPKWNHAGGVVVDGLTKRRLAEQTIFNTTLPLNTSQPVPLTDSGPQRPSTVDVINNAAQSITSFFSDLENKLGS